MILKRICNFHTCLFLILTSCSYTPAVAASQPLATSYLPKLLLLEMDLPVSNAQNQQYAVQLPRIHHASVMPKTVIQPIHSRPTTSTTHMTNWIKSRSTVPHLPRPRYAEQQFASSKPIALQHPATSLQLSNPVEQQLAINHRLTRLLSQKTIASPQAKLVDLAALSDKQHGVVLPIQKKKATPKLSNQTKLPVVPKLKAKPKMTKPKVARNKELEYFIQLTLATNPEILAERANWLRDTHLARRAQGALFPKVDVSYSVGRENSNNHSLKARNIFNKKLTRHQAFLDVNQLVFDGGESLTRYRSAKQAIKASHNRVEQIKQNLVLNVIQAYVDIARFQELKHLAEKNIETHKSALDKVKKRFTGGVGRASDVELATARLALAQATLQNTIDSLNAANYSFIRLTGKTVKAPKYLIDPAHRLPKTLKQAESLGLRKNPRILEARNLVKVSKLDASIARSAFSPKVNVNFQSNHSQDVGGIDGSNVAQQVNLNISYNLFNGGADLAAARASQQQMLNAKDVLSNTERTVLENIRTAWSGYNIIKKRLPLLNIHLKAMKRTANNYREQFKLGQRTLLDELNAETEVFNANNNVINAQSQLVISAYSILFATGQIA